VSPAPRATLEGVIARLRERAAAFAANRHSLRETSTPAGQRAALRLIGVHGLDDAGEPLAGRVVDRALEAGLGDSADAIVLPLAGAAGAAGLGPRELALMIAAGSVDLTAEDALLQDPARAALARQRLSAWRSDAGERIEANRTARHELGDALGWPGRPWIGGRTSSHGMDAALSEARALVEAGADAVVVRVPRGREMGGEPGAAAGEPVPRELEPPPAGSQRGLARVRAALDEMGAEHGRYVFLGTATDPLAAPEQALVAAFERIDLVFADPFDEVAAGVGVERALADHAAAHDLLRRSGATLVLSAGPLLAGPEFRRGEDVAAHTRIARSIAAQAASAAWAAGSELPADRVLLQAPFELPASRTHMPLLAAAVLVRHMLHPTHPLVVTEPSGVPGPAWRTGLPICLLAAGGAQLVLHAGAGDDLAVRADETRAGAALAALLPELLHPGAGAEPRFADAIMRIALDLTTEAIETFGAVERDGWEVLAGTASPAALSSAGHGAGILSL
jgi:hypothetical protein